jgi:hypothetical protein
MTAVFPHRLYIKNQVEFWVLNVQIYDLHVKTGTFKETSVYSLEETGKKKSRKFTAKAVYLDRLSCVVVKVPGCRS